MNEREYLAKRAKLLDEGRKLNDLTIAEERDFSAEEKTAWEKVQEDVKALDARYERSKIVGEPEAREAQKPAKSPAHLRLGLGDNFEKAVGAYIRKGDTGGVSHMMDGEIPGGVTFRASNATDMNIGTAADGGYAVPTGFYNQVIARRDEMSLPAALGCRKIPGKGTTVNVPLDGEDDGEFVVTTEANTFDQDAPAIGQAAMTLALYSKHTLLSVQLMEDEDAAIMDFLGDFFARGQAKTLNNLLITEAAAGGTSLVTTASATAFASGELESIAYNDALANYLDDSGSCAWVTRASTYGALATLAGNPHIYSQQAAGDRGAIGGSPIILGFPVKFSYKVAAPTAGLKSLYLGNWNFMGWRMAPEFTMLRDPYSKASTGQTALWMYFRTVFKTLQAEAIGYATMHA